MTTRKTGGMLCPCKGLILALSLSNPIPIAYLPFCQLQLAVVLLIGPL